MFHFSVKYIDPKARKKKKGLKLNVLFTLFIQFLVENRIFSKLPPFQLNNVLNLKCSADQILTLKSDFVSFDHLRVAIRSFSNN